MCWLNDNVVVNFSLTAVLSGTKYGLKQTRGKFGLGAKMVCNMIQPIYLFESISLIHYSSSLWYNLQTEVSPHNYLVPIFIYLFLLLSNCFGPSSIDNMIGAIYDIVRRKPLLTPAVGMETAKKELFTYWGEVKQREKKPLYLGMCSRRCSVEFSIVLH